MSFSKINHLPESLHPPTGRRQHPVDLVDTLTSDLPEPINGFYCIPGDSPANQTSSNHNRWCFCQ
ncbi:hypothetical protein EYF80_063832 [Liparis tanakae]|uniref:Uncharacterized protein n=1 Tax=Liparis tanakae TaxID=230148 RepID=A0A4Z2ECK9_9TELE|nr:hypothetical protein EYF80_063832 [Liparis tanakae]